MSFRGISQDPSGVRRTLHQANENQRNLGERPVDITTRSSVGQLNPGDRFAGDIWDPESRVGITGEFGSAANTVSGPEASPIAQEKLQRFMDMFMSNCINVESFNPVTEMPSAPMPMEGPVA